MDDLFDLLKQLDGRAFSAYQALGGKSFRHDRYHLGFVHVQGSPGAFPASVCQLRVKVAELGLPEHCLCNRIRRMATADFLLRAFQAGVVAHARQNRGDQGSGSFQPLSLPPQVLERNLVRFDPEWVLIVFCVSLPGSHTNRVLGRQAALMFSQELAGIVETLQAWVADGGRRNRHCDVVEDMVSLQRQLSRLGLVAFVGDGAILPRQSGVSQSPMQQGAVAFQAPGDLALEVALPHAGRIRGLGIRPGVSVLIGGSFHGKSTLLDALVHGVYPHIPGDGRERVVTHPEALFVCAEEGRTVNGLDISGFIDRLPGEVDARRFWTQNASGSTSEAAAIVEAILAGTGLMLIDEDSSAANLLIKDRHMRRLIPKDTITPLFDRVQELYHRFGVSTLMVVGGSSDYLGVADHVILMEDYLPKTLTDAVRQLSLPGPRHPPKPLVLSDRRRVLADNFDPSYQVKRMDKTLSVRIKPLRLQEKILEYGNQQLDLSRLKALVDPHQVLAVGYGLLLARKKLLDGSISPSELAGAIHQLIEREGLAALQDDPKSPVFLAQPRRLELAGAINRLRNLKIAVQAA
jgi:predicted ABC-class ATPase